MRKEKNFQNKVLKDLKTLPKTWVLKTQERARRGVPDLLICANGAFVALELKASEEAIVRQLQIFELEEIYKSGGAAFVVYPENWDEILLIIKKILALQMQCKLQLSNEKK